jgi:flagellin
MLSVNTNTGAMTALQYLNNTVSSLNQTEARVNSGMKVAGAKDNGAIYSIAQTMRGNVAGYQAVTDSLNRASSVVDTSLAAAQSVSDLLIQMKQNALSGADTSLDASSRTSLNNDFSALADQISTIVKNATFNGINLVDGGSTNVSALASSNDTTQRITVAHSTLTLTALKISNAGYSTAGTASNMVSTISAAIATVNTALSSLSAGSKKFSIQSSFVSKLSDTLTAGIGNLVDANMASESATLTALQTKQQLGVQALGIANQAPQIVLSLFR